jgi:hypothetical protein
MTVRIKFGIALVLIIIACMSLLLFYLPEHWLRQVTDFATVTLDGRRVQADIYLGQPTTNEAEAFLLVRIPGEGSFLLNFLDENFREISTHEFVRLYRGVVTFKPMSGGPWVPPLPFLTVDELRIRSSNGRTITVKLGK